MVGVSFSVCCLLFLIIVAIFYFNKKKINNFDNRIFSIMIIINIIGTLIDVSGYFSFKLLGADNHINIIISKLYLIYFLSNGFCLMLYICNLSFEKFQAKLNIYILVFCIICLSVLILPIKIHFDGVVGYTSGESVNLAYGTGFLIIIIMLYSLIKSIKKIGPKKYVPLFAFAFLTLLTVLIQKINPQITLLLLSNTIVTFLMFFTLENPDLKMLEELSKAEILSEQTNDEKSNFLYVVNDIVNNNLNTAEKIYQNVNKLNPSPEIKEEMDDLKNLVDISRVKIRQTLDVSELDTRELYPINTKYDLKLLINSIYLQLKQNVNNNIDFRLNIIGNIPQELYGDSIKIKQVLTTIITNSIKYTKTGFIEFRVDSIIKFDACRLIFTIEDSGIGMSLLKQNEILSNHEELTPEELNEKDNINLNLKMIRKIINIIGGNLTIESELNKGTSIKINIDQKIAKEEQSNEEKTIEKYSNEIKNKQRVAIISTDNDEFKVIKKALKKFDINTETFIETLPCLTNIRNNICYDVIFIDENTDKIDAESFLYKVKMVEGYKTRIIVITPSKDFNRKKELINKGFSNVITLPINRDEIRNKIVE